MYYRPRIIPTLLIDDGNLVKTKNFKNANYLGDPINAIKIFNEKGVDELCVLDISASKNNREPDFELLSLMASESFMPLSYGGGIKNLDQVKKLFRSGFEKVVINTAGVNNQTLLREVSNYFGKQSVVASIDYRQTLTGRKCYICDGTQKTSFTPIEMAVQAEKNGAGELLLYSIDRDGSRKGYDIETIKNVVKQVRIPVIACGGARDLDDIKEVLEQTGTSAVAAGSMFVYYGARDAVLINFPEERSFFEKGIFKEEDNQYV
jgi:cyclase